MIAALKKLSVASTLTTSPRTLCQPASLVWKRCWSAQTALTPACTIPSPASTTCPTYCQIYSSECLDERIIIQSSCGHYPGHPDRCRRSSWHCRAHFTQSANPRHIAVFKNHGCYSAALERRRPESARIVPASQKHTSRIQRGRRNSIAPFYPFPNFKPSDSGYLLVLFRLTKRIPEIYDPLIKL